MSRVYSKPAAIVASTEPTGKIGVAIPVCEMKPPEATVAMVNAMMSGKLRTPESVGLTLSMLWK